MELQNQNYGANKQSDLFKDLILMYVVAKSGSGKSYLISSLLQNDKYGLNKRFLGDQIFLFSPTQQIDDSQIETREFIKKMKTNDGYKFDEEAQFFQTNIISAIQNLYDQQIDIKKSDQELGTKKSRELLFIIDDCQGSKYLDTRQNSQMEQLMVKIRHANINVIMICQEYKRGASPVIRAQFNMIILFYLPNYGDQKKIVEELSGNTKKKFESIYQDATKERYQALLIMQDFPLQYKYFKIVDAKNNKILQYQI